MTNTLELAKRLMVLPSVTPDDAGCQSLIAEQLTTLGFNCQALRFGNVDNLWATYGSEQPCLIFAGHTDVVPAGDEAAWNSPPFSPTIKDDFLIGRGAADMKGALAAMLIAVKQFISQHNKFKGSIGFLITSDEEGDAINGTCQVVKYLKDKKIQVDYCIVGEPSCSNVLGDTIKNGRRGSLSGRLTIKGKQGHIAYPHLADNAIHKALPVLTALINEHWDEGNEYFPPTCLQLSNVNAGTGVGNVIPGSNTIDFNLRYSSELTDTQIKQRISAILEQHKVNYSIEWKPTGKPFLTKPGKLITACQQAIKTATGQTAELSTNGGTSDGRFITELGCEVIEFGLINQTIHQVNESTKIVDLELLTAIYQNILAKIFNT